jgi:hypothetical protein
MEKVAPVTAFLTKVVANIVDLNQGQFMEGVPLAWRWDYPTPR